MALISVNDVSIRFRGPALLDGVSCQIEAGQRIGLLGRNGSGKTTLLRMFCRAKWNPTKGKSPWRRRPRCRCCRRTFRKISSAAWPTWSPRA